MNRTLFRLATVCLVVGSIPAVSGCSNTIPSTDEPFQAASDKLRGYGIESFRVTQDEGRLGRYLAVFKDASGKVIGQLVADEDLELTLRDVRLLLQGQGEHQVAFTFGDHSGVVAT